MAKTKEVRNDGVEFKLGDIVSINDVYTPEQNTNTTWNRFQIVAFNKTVTLVRVANVNGVLEGTNFMKVYCYLGEITKVSA